MAKESTHLDLTLPPRGDDEPIGQWLVSSLRSAILRGRLPPGARLPSTRNMARMNSNCSRQSNDCRRFFQRISRQARSSSASCSASARTLIASIPAAFG
jgi:DNA-binding transcriptional MocR family regulator